MLGWFKPLTLAFIIGTIVPPIAWILAFRFLGDPCVIYCGDAVWKLMDACGLNIAIACFFLIFVPMGNINEELRYKQSLESFGRFSRGFVLGTVATLLSMGLFDLFHHL